MPPPAPGRPLRDGRFAAAAIDDRKAGRAHVQLFDPSGAGLPAGGNTHEIAQRIAPDSGIVYADNDPVVIMHAKALLGSPMLASTPGGAVCYTDADLRDVAAVLAGAASTLDMSRPVALIMLGILGHIDDYGAARSITARLTGSITRPSAPSSTMRRHRCCRRAACPCVIGRPTAFSASACS